MRFVLKFLLVCALSVGPSIRSDACAMFTMVHGDSVLMANNEDFIKPGHIWFVPGGKNRYGRVNVGFADKFAQGSMNEAGLCFDAAALPKVPYEPDKSKKSPRNLIEKIMNECATVDEAIAYFEQYNCKYLAEAQFMFADKSGASAVITWDPRGHLSVTKRSEPYQLITNDRLEFSSYRCQRYVLADRVLSASAELQVETARDVLAQIQQRGEGAFTSYSNVYDLKAGKIHLFNLANFDEMITLDLQRELEKGKRSYAMVELFEHSPSLASIRDDERVKYDTRYALTTEALERFAGEYVFEAEGQRFPMLIEVNGNDLVLKRDGQRDATLFPEGERLFRLTDGGGQIAFESDADGTITAMVLYRNGDHRAPRVN